MITRHTHDQRVRSPLMAHGGTLIVERGAHQLCHRPACPPVDHGSHRESVIARSDTCGARATASGDRGASIRNCLRRRATAELTGSRCPWIEVIVTGHSAEARATLPLHWQQRSLPGQRLKARRPWTDVSVHRERLTGSHGGSPTCDTWCTRLRTNVSQAGASTASIRTDTDIHGTRRTPGCCATCQRTRRGAQRIPALGHSTSSKARINGGFCADGSVQLRSGPGGR
jgi:hypothetical protein